MIVAAQAGVRTGWEGWPFGGSMAGSITASVARIAFVLVVFGIIVWFLRFLYGPKGKLRPKEFGTEHIEERKRKKATVGELRRKYKAKEISLDEFLAAEKEIWGKDDASS